MDLRERFLALEVAYKAFKTDFDIAHPVTPVVNDRIIEVFPGQDLQAAINTAPPGSMILLTPGGVYGRITLPVKDGTTAIAIRPSRELPPGRLNPNALPFILPRIQGDGVGELIKTVPKSHHFLLQGIELRAAPGQTVVSLGLSTERTVADLPSDITLDRMWIHADPLYGGHRGIAMNSGNNTSVLNSVIEGFWQVGRDSQAICGWNGVGPFRVENNYLEGSGENFMLGGGDCVIPGEGPGMLMFRRNMVRKPQAWRAIAGTVKNLFELKNCRTAYVEENVFDGCWADRQSGSGIVLTPRNQEGTRPDSIIRDMVFVRNVVKNVSNFAFNLLGWDDLQPINERSRNLDILENLLLARNGIQVLQGWDGLRITHNNLPLTRGSFLMFEAGLAPDGTVLPTKTIDNFQFSDNIAASGAYGVAGSGTTLGNESLKRYAPGFEWRRNVIEKSSERGITYPTETYLLAAGSLMTTHLNADFSPRAEGGITALLTPSTDGTVPGVNMNAMKAAGIDTRVEDLIK